MTRVCPILLACGLLPGLAGAQESTGIEEVVVTARKTSESLQSVPAPLSVVTAESIRDLGLRNLSDMAALTSGLQQSGAIFGRNQASISLRGRSNGPAIAAGTEASTAFFIDGVLYNGTVALIDFDALERVEVIKGPQSALYGRTTYAGAINFITRDPGDKQSFTAKTTFGEFGERQYSASNSGPITDTLSYRVSARYDSYDGEFTNHVTGDRSGARRDNSTWMTLVWKPNADLRLRLTGNYTYAHDSEVPIYLQGAALNNCSPGFASAGYRVPAAGVPASTNVNQAYCGVVVPHPELVAANTRAGTNFLTGAPVAAGMPYAGFLGKNTFGTLIADWDIGGSGWTLTSATSSRHSISLNGNDTDGLPFNYPQSSLFVRDNVTEKSQELRFSSPSSQRWRAMVGAYYYKRDKLSKDLTFANPYLGEYTGINSNLTGIKNSAVFGSITVDATEKLQASLEVRRSRDEKSLSAPTLALPPTAGFDGTATFNSTTPRFTLDYHLTPDVMIYGVYAEGRKPGGLNGQIANTANTVLGTPGFYKVAFGEEKGKNYELGTKTSWFERRLVANLSVFRFKAEDVQTGVVLPLGVAGILTSNSGTAKTDGVELDLQAVLNRQISAIANFSRASTTTGSGCSTAVYRLDTGGLTLSATTPCNNLADTAAQVVSTASLTLDGHWQLSDRLTMLTVGSFSHVEPVSTTASRTAPIAAYSGTVNEFGLRLGLQSDSGWSATLYGRNLTDEDAVLQANAFADNRYTCPPASGGPPPCNTVPANTVAYRGVPNGLQVVPRPGRAFGVELRYDF